MKNELLIQFERARQDLGISFEAPYLLHFEDGTSLTVPIRLLNFGHPKGMIIFTDFDSYRAYADRVVKLGYGFSTLTSPYGPYKKDSMIEMLSDWGWSGKPEERPAWLLDPPMDD